MELLFLGTSAGRPVQGRNVTAAALLLPQERGVWLFDCGEGTQHQLMRAGVKLTKLQQIFITHMHGDHTFGLPGLLSTRSSLGTEEPLRLYGPSGLRDWVQRTLALTDTRLGYALEITEVRPGAIYEDERLRVVTDTLEHRVACYGYRIEEKPQRGRLKAELLQGLGVPFGPLYGQLKEGQDVQLPDGLLIRSDDVTEPARSGRIVTILGDTRPCANAVRLAQGADLVVHEATFDAALEDKALAYGHSTTVQAAHTASEAGARRLLLTHFSARFTEADMAQLAEEARALFPATETASDFAVVAVRHANRADA
ncbi:ribonuclease Z [Paenibacillus sp. IB182496]|uniref:Ribonuclease Z n=1 Tax=Paenibacillus sabuli TaxID=2772509 RepID=A0A927BUU9_9BACL|nr:ribonuclease Z [Paenibacillus sabuli]MBD2846757.1 ribonuclease Z [Paenibacillus sabuli]